MNDYTMNVTSINDLITASGIVEDNQKIFITGAQLKKCVPDIIKITQDIEICHKLCADMGLPYTGCGTNGLVQRLQELQKVYP